MGRPSDWMREVTGRAPMRSPGHPGHQRMMERRFWDQIAEGLLPTEAAVAVGVSPVKGTRSVIVVSHNACFDGGRARQAWKVLGAILHPCAVSARQIGATPNRARYSAMNRQTISVASRSLARRNLLLPRGSRSSRQLGDLTFLLPDDPGRLTRGPLGLAAVDRGLANPFPQGLRGHTQPRRDSRDRGPLTVVILAVIANQPHSLGSGRFVVLRWHDLPILPKKEGEHQTRRDSLGRPTPRPKPKPSVNNLMTHNT